MTTPLNGEKKFVNSFPHSTAHFKNLMANGEVFYDNKHRKSFRIDRIESNKGIIYLQQIFKTKCVLAPIYSVNFFAQLMLTKEIEIVRSPNYGKL